jgi:hypothetical protein
MLFALRPPNAELLVRTHWDVRVILFAFAMAATTGFVFGVEALRAE